MGHTKEPWTDGYGPGITGPTGVINFSMALESQFKPDDSEEMISIFHHPISVPLTEVVNKSIAYVVWAGSISEEEALANAARIVACVNGCAGIPDPSAVGELVAVLKEVEAVMAKNVYPQPDKPESSWGVLCRVREVLARLTP